MAVAGLIPLLAEGAGALGAELSPELISGATTLAQYIPKYAGKAKKIVGSLVGNKKSRKSLLQHIKSLGTKKGLKTAVKSVGKHIVSGKALQDFSNIVGDVANVEQALHQVGGPKTNITESLLPALKHAQSVTHKAQSLHTMLNAGVPKKDIIV